MNRLIKEKIKRSSMWIFVIICLTIVLSITIKYHFIGEVNMPFKPDEMLVISACEGIANDDNPEGYRWNLDLIQYNDIYIHFAKSNDDQVHIRNVTIENVKCEGIEGIKTYMPSSKEGTKFEYSDDYEIRSSLTFKGNENDDHKNLKICSNGGSILFRVANFNLGKLQSNADEIIYDGRLLKDANISLESLKFTLKFDILLDTSNDIIYRGTFVVDMPCGNIIEEGTSKLDKTDLSDVIFKRD
jgi:hypothetical protein